MSVRKTSFVVEILSKVKTVGIQKPLYCLWRRRNVSVESADTWAAFQDHALLAIVFAVGVSLASSSGGQSGESESGEDYLLEGEHYYGDW